MNGMIERATEMPNVNNVASDTMDEEDVKALVLSLEEHGIEHPKTKALIRRIEQRVGAEKAAVLKARAEDRAFGTDQPAPKSQRPAAGGTAEGSERSGKAPSKGTADTKKEFRSKKGEGAPPFAGGQDTDPKFKQARGPRGGGTDRDPKTPVGTGGGGGEGKGGR